MKAESVLLGVLRDIRHAGYSACLVKILAYRAVEFAMRGEVLAVGPGTLPVPVPMAYEQALLATGRAMGKCGKATVMEAKAYLRDYGVSGAKLASKTLSSWCSTPKTPSGTYPWRPRNGASLSASFVEYFMSS